MGRKPTVEVMKCEIPLCVFAPRETFHFIISVRRDMMVGWWLWAAKAGWGLWAEVCGPPAHRRDNEVEAPLPFCAPGGNLHFIISA